MSRGVLSRHGASSKERAALPLQPWALHAHPRARRGRLALARAGRVRAPLARLQLSGASSRRPSPAARARGFARARRAAARRRLILGALSGSLVVAVVLAVAGGLSAAWWAAAGMVLVMCGYLGLLSWARKVAAEREFTLAFLPARAGATRLEELFSQPREGQTGTERGEPLRASSG